RASLAQLALGCSLRLRRCLASQAKPPARAEGTRHSGNDRSEGTQADLLLGKIVVDRLHTAAHAIRLMPEARPAGVLQECFPPLPMGRRPSPGFHRVEVTPVPAHSHMEREEAVDDVLFAVKQAFRSRLASRRDSRPKSHDRLKSS